MNKLCIQYKKPDKVTLYFSVPPPVTYTTVTQRTYPETVVYNQPSVSVTHYEPAVTPILTQSVTHSSLPAATSVITDYGDRPSYYSAVGGAPGGAYLYRGVKSGYYTPLYRSHA